MVKAKFKKRNFKKNYFTRKHLLLLLFFHFSFSLGHFNLQVSRRLFISVYICLYSRFCINLLTWRRRHVFYKIPQALARMCATFPWCNEGLRRRQRLVVQWGTGANKVDLRADLVQRQEVGPQSKKKCGFVPYFNGVRWNVFTLPCGVFSATFAVCCGSLSKSLRRSFKFLGWVVLDSASISSASSSAGIAKSLHSCILRLSASPFVACSCSCLTLSISLWRCSSIRSSCLRLSASSSICLALSFAICAFPRQHRLSWGYRSQDRGGFVLTLL
jgi:hypothetical protein